MRRTAFSVRIQDPAQKGTLRDWLVLGVALALASGMWLYAQWVMVPAERAHYLAMGQVADVGDLYPRWYGARELLLHQRDPYSAEVSREIQVAYYGHALDTAGADRGRDEQRFAYPVYAVFFLAPTVELSFAQAQTVVRWVLALLAAWSVLLWLRALRWRASRVATLAMVMLVLSSPPVVQALRLQQLALLVAFLLAGCAALVVRGRLVWAGGLLAYATVKPQLALLPVLCFLIWVAGDWKKRQGLFWGFGGTLALLIGVGQLLLPGWLPEFVRGLVAYRHYAGMSSWLDALLTPGVAKPVAAVLLGALLLGCWRGRRVAASEPEFMARLCLVLAAAVVALPLLPPFNQMLLVPGVLLVISYWNNLWRRGRLVRAVYLLGAAIAASSWVAAAVLATGFALTGRTSTTAWEWPFVLTLGMPPVVAGLLLVLRVGGAGSASGAPSISRIYSSWD